MAIRYAYQGAGFSSDQTRLVETGYDRAWELFASMLRIRRVEEKIESRYHEDQMKTPVHLVIGHEAVSAGVCAALLHDDDLFCTYRSHGHYLAKGGDLNAMIAELHCRETGCVGSRGGSMHLLDLDAHVLGCSAIVGGIVPIAAGNALAQQMRSEPRLTVVFLGDAATEEGVVWETLNFAALRKLPLLVVCENNAYSVCSPLENRQPRGSSIFERVRAFGIPGEVADGTNVLAVYEAACKAVKHIRSGQGPAFLEIPVYRMRGHHGAGDDSHTGYRDPEEVAHWQVHDPIEGLAAFLRTQQVVHIDRLETLEAEISAEVESAFAFALASPEPEPETVLKYVYAD